MFNATLNILGYIVAVVLLAEPEETIDPRQVNDVLPNMHTCKDDVCSGWRHVIISTVL